MGWRPRLPGLVSTFATAIFVDAYIFVAMSIMRVATKARNDRTCAIIAADKRSQNPGQGK
jgi:hypothetical protein